MITAFALLGPLLAVGGDGGPARAVFPAETQLVVLQATVRNGRGELVTNLGRDAFTVYEDGRAQPITVFHAEDIPVSLGLVIDNSGSMRTLRAKVEAAALTCVRASNPADEVFVVNFADRPAIDVPLTSDVGQVEKGIGRLDSIGGTALRDAVETAIAYAVKEGHRDRKALVVVSDGNDNASAASLGQVRREAEQAEVVVYAVGLVADDDPARSRRAHHELDELASLTGGVAYYPASLEELGAIATSIAHQIRSQYTIGYRPTERSLDGSYRKLRVVARGPERLAVRTRAGFRVPTAAPPGP